MWTHTWSTLVLESGGGGACRQARPLSTAQNAAYRPFRSLVRRRLSITISVAPEKLNATLQPLRQRRPFIGRSLQRTHAIDSDKMHGCRAYGRPLELIFHFAEGHWPRSRPRHRLPRLRDYLEAVKMVCRWAKAGGIKPLTTLAGVPRPMAAASSPFLTIQHGCAATE